MYEFSIIRSMAQCQMGINGFGRIGSLVVRAARGIEFSIIRSMAQCQMGINCFGRIGRLVFRATMGNAQVDGNAVDDSRHAH